MQTHKLPTGKRAFEAIKTKTIEVRAYYPERHNIKPRDHILFTCDDPTFEWDGTPIEAEVVKLTVAKTPEELSEMINISETEISDTESWLQYMHSFYTDAQIKEHGIVAIHLKH